MSKLVVLVRLKTSKVYFRLYRSVMLVDLDQREIGALLEGLAEDVALAVGEVGFVIGSVDGDARRQDARRSEQGNA